MKHALIIASAFGLTMVQANAENEANIQEEFPIIEEVVQIEPVQDPDALTMQINDLEVQTDEDVHSKINEVESLVNKIDHKDDELSDLIDELAAKQIEEKKQAEERARQQKLAQKRKPKAFKASSGSKLKLSNKKLSNRAAPVIAARRASRSAHSRSRGLCARYVRVALQSAGYRFTPNASAYQYASRGTLRKAGFVKISNNSRPQVGDVVVINRSRAHPHGHIAIYDGRNWVSDFRQKNKSPYSRYYPYTTWRDARYMNNASSKGLYMATR